MPARFEVTDFDTGEVCMSQANTQLPPLFQGGPNIAIKLPPHVFDSTVSFYRDTLRLPQLTEYNPNHVFQFGANVLWLDRIEQLSQAEVWLEILTSDIEAAKQHFATQGITRCDEIEPLPSGFSGFWLLSPASIVHLAVPMMADARENQHCQEHANSVASP
jgi:hypothetical protein